MMDKKGIPQYRCQRCGEVVMSSKTPLAAVAILELFTQNPFAVSINGVFMRAIHECEDCGCGIAVIIGFFPAERLPELQEAERKRTEAETHRRSQLASSAN